MTASSQFYLAQAAICTKSAQNASLANQRDMYLRAGAAWQALADREDDVTAAREQRDADKVARQIVAAPVYTELDDAEPADADALFTAASAEPVSRNDDSAISSGAGVHDTTALFGAAHSGETS
ncbi:hypothetical protein [Novosphingobium sp.]|uniref:hypothetical protein n=1 Tax=Novosphingobium sp. TaxID=1874826 RepID=UPI003341CC57